MTTNQSQRPVTIGEGLQKYTGTCHCGAVRFRAELDLSQGATRCNCSICTKLSQLTAICRPDQFALLSGEEQLGSYAWGGKTGTRMFCKACHVYVFGPGHLAELGGDYVAVNVNTLDEVEVGNVNVLYWDGRHDNWAAGPRATPWSIFASPS